MLAASRSGGPGSGRSATASDTSGNRAGAQTIDQLFGPLPTTETQGRVWLGAQARQNGLIDELGGYDRAVALIKERAKLKPEDKVTLVPYPPPRKLLDLLMSRLAAAESDDVVLSWLQRRFGASTPWRSLLQGGALKISPYWVTVQ